MRLFFLFIVPAAAVVQEITHCIDCGSCCGFRCLSYDNSSGCTLSNSTQLTHPRVMPAGNCFHELQECVSCPGEEDVWRDSLPKLSLTLHVSGDCHQPRWGRIEWSQTLRLSGSLQGPATIVGSCPLVTLLSGAEIIDVEFECTNGGDAPAIEVVSGEGVLLRNVSALHASVFRAANVDGVDMDGFSASVSSSHRTIAAIGNGRGRFEIDCQSAGLVAVQRLDNSSATYTGTCDAVDVSSLLNAFGTLYETKFYNKNAYEDVEGSLVDTLFYWSWRVALALVLLFGLVHEDYSAVRDITQLYK